MAASIALASLTVGLLPAGQVAALPSAPGASAEVQAAATAPCAAAIAYGVAGSGQQKDDPAAFGPQVFHVIEGIAADLPSGTLSRVSISYPALGVETLAPTDRQKSLYTSGKVLDAYRDWRDDQLADYLASIEQGVTELSAAVSDLSSSGKCPGHRLVLVGYSQGASVVHQFLTRAKSRGDTALLSRVSAVVLLADPDQVSSSKVVRLGTARQRSQGVNAFRGTGALLALRGPGPNEDVPRNIAGRTWAVCRAWDPVCDFAPRRLMDWPIGRGRHSGYVHNPNDPDPSKRATNEPVRQAIEEAANAVAKDALGTPRRGWLYEYAVDSSGVGRSGYQRDAIAHFTRFPNATSQWVGCSGSPAQSSYRLAGIGKTLTGTLGLDLQSTPAGLRVDFTISGDGRTLGTYSLTKTELVPVSLNVSGVQTLNIAAMKTAGTCGTAADGYGVLGNFMVS